MTREIIERYTTEMLPYPSGTHQRDLLLEKLQIYASLLIKWNKVYNLTAITKIEEIAYKHFLDSLLVLPYLQGKEILDIGSGAGLPGIPLALSCPESFFTLVDTNSKKARFLRQVVTELALSNVDVAQTRIETYRPQKKFDTVLARAFAATTVIVEAAQCLLAPEGQILAMKGKVEQEALAGLPEGYVVQEVIRVDTKTVFSEVLGQRHIIRIVRK